MLTKPISQADDLRKLDGEWIYVEDRTEGRPLEQLGPPISSRFLFKVEEGAIILVCDFALGHLAGRLATKANAEKEPVLAEMRASLVPGAVLVPSGIFDAAQAQNAGCAFIPA